MRRLKNLVCLFGQCFGSGQNGFHEWYRLVVICSRVESKCRDVFPRVFAGIITNLYHQLMIDWPELRVRCCPLWLELRMLRQGCAQNTQENWEHSEQNVVFMVYAMVYCTVLDLLQGIPWGWSPLMPVQCAALLLGGGIRSKTTWFKIGIPDWRCPKTPDPSYGNPRPS